MLTLMLWLNAHRAWVVVVVALCLWTGPYFWYFRAPVRKWLKRGKRHNWSVDILQRKAVINGKEQVR
jgi:hypothetical protein